MPSKHKGFKKVGIFSTRKGAEKRAQRISPSMAWKVTETDALIRTNPRTKKKTLVSVGGKKGKVFRLWAKFK